MSNDNDTDLTPINRVDDTVTDFKYYLELEITKRDGREYTKGGVEITPERLKQACERFMSVFNQAPKGGAPQER